MMEIIFAGVTAWLIAQLIKFFHDWSMNKKPRIKAFLASGGMPSSHTAMVTAAAFRVGILEGFNSSGFAIIIVFALIVVYDATGVRRAVGIQAQKLNQLLEDSYVSHSLDIEKVKEILGHTPMQVLGGAILGVIVGILWPF